VATDNLEAKQFDLLILRMQLTLLRAEPGFNKLKESVQRIARLLEEQTAIPAIAAKLPLIQEVQSTLFWEGVTVAGLEDMRRGLRELVKLIERRKRATVISDFEDELGVAALIDLPGVGVRVDSEKVREKATVFLRKHELDPAIHKLRFNEPLTNEDLREPEKIFANEGSCPEEIEIAKNGDGLGLFVRSLVGLDREAAKNALSGFLRDRNLTANQIEFTNLIINHLAARGWISPAQLYDSPFTDIHPHGVDGVFDDLPRKR
jgi:type I restriction enzyme, R subunit